MGHTVHAPRHSREIQTPRSAVTGGPRAGPTAEEAPARGPPPVAPSRFRLYSLVMVMVGLPVMATPASVALAGTVTVTVSSAVME